MNYIAIVIAFGVGFIFAKLTNKKKVEFVKTDEIPKKQSKTLQKNIYVGNLSHAISEQDLIETFEVFGKVEKASIVKDKNRGSMKRFAFVEMADAIEASSAVESLNGREVKGRVLKVSFAHDKNSKSYSRNSARRRYASRRNYRNNTERAV